MAVRAALILAFALLALAGCGEAESSAATLKGPIQYSRSGGFAGVVEKMTINTNGRGETRTVSRKRSFTLGAKQRRSLEKAVERAKLRDVKSPKAGSGNDALYYAISYRGHRVAWSDLTTSPPEAVMELYAMLGDIYESHRPR
jgi:hypothetical protein